jgi:hypothetical protein
MKKYYCITTIGENKHFFYSNKSLSFVKKIASTVYHTTGADEITEQQFLEYYKALAEKDADLMLTQETLDLHKEMNN